MKKHKPFVVLKVKDKWFVFLNRVKKSVSFLTKNEAEEYKQFLDSR